MRVRSAGEPVAGRGLMSGCHGAERSDWTERVARRVRGTRVRKERRPPGENTTVPVSCFSLRRKEKCRLVCPFGAAKRDSGDDHNIPLPGTT